MNILQKIIITVGITSLWCFFHSFLISRTLKKKIGAATGLQQENYRIFYNLFSIFTLLPIIWFLIAPPQTLLFDWTGILRLPQTVILLYAFMMFYGGWRDYDMEVFWGFKEQPSTDQDLQTDGIHAYIRHPWYSGGIAFLWGIGWYTDINLAARVVFTIYLLIGGILEERKLIRRFGRSYEVYRKQAGMFWPWKKRIYPVINDSLCRRPSYSGAGCRRILN